MVAYTGGQWVYFLTNNLDQNISFIRCLNEEGLLTLWSTFLLIKYCSYTHGGFVKRSDYTNICQEIGISDSTLRHTIGRLKREKLLVKTKTGYNIAGWRKLPAEKGFDLRKILFQGKNKVELINNVTNRYIRHSIKKQHFVRSEKHHNWLDKISGGTYKDANYTLSCRNIANTLGYKSAATGSKIEKRLEKSKRIKIQRRSIPVCSIQQYNAIRVAFPEIASRCYLIGQNVMMRICNNLIPLRREITPEERFIKKLLSYCQRKRRYGL